MLPNLHLSSPAPSNPAWRRWVQAAFAAMLLAGCGGSGDAGAPTSFARGTITGFGSIIVGGVHFDETHASIRDDEGNEHARDMLKLGMQVEVVAGAMGRSRGRSGASAMAHSVRFGSEIVGPATLIDAAAGTLSVLDQNVVVDARTVFGDGLAGGLAALADQQVVEIHAVFDAATASYRATRIEDETGASFYKLRGRVSALDTTAKTFQINAAVINYGGVDPATLPPMLDNGMSVRVRLQTAKLDGQWVATRVSLGERGIDDHDEAEVEGFISEFSSSTSFHLNGLLVDASAASFPDGTDGLRLGARVEVEGSIRAGVLLATKVEIEDMPGDVGRNGFELLGSISNLDLAAHSFIVHQVKVVYDDATQFVNGTVDQLANDVVVEIRGLLAGDRITLLAKEIKFQP